MSADDTRSICVVTGIDIYDRVYEDDYASRRSSSKIRIRPRSSRGKSITVTPTVGWEMENLLLLNYVYAN